MRTRATTYRFLLNDPATSEIYTLSLHDALPISLSRNTMPIRFRIIRQLCASVSFSGERATRPASSIDRKSTRLNSSHVEISYAVFCLKKKNHDESSNEKSCCLRRFCIGCCTE